MKEGKISNQKQYIAQCLTEVFFNILAQKICKGYSSKNDR